MAPVAPAAAPAAPPAESKDESKGEAEDETKGDAKAEESAPPPPPAESVPGPPMTGRVALDVKSGEFNKDLDTFGKMDPYVVVWAERASELSSREPKGPWKDGERDDEGHTRPVESGGKNPTFTNAHNSNLTLNLFETPVSQADHDRTVVFVEAWDDEAGDGNGELIGQGVLELGGVVDAGSAPGEHRVPVYTDDGTKLAGHVTVHASWHEIKEEPPVSGRLYLDAEKAEFKRDADTFGAMDP